MNLAEDAIEDLRNIKFDGHIILSTKHPNMEIRVGCPSSEQIILKLKVPKTFWNKLSWRFAELLLPICILEWE